MKEGQNGCHTTEAIYSEGYKDFLEFHNTILLKVQNTIQGGQTKALTSMKKIEQQGYDVFALMNECQENLLGLLPAGDIAGSVTEERDKKVCSSEASSCSLGKKNNFIADYSLESMPINRYEVYAGESPLQDTEHYTLPKKGTVLLVGPGNRQVDEWVEYLGLTPEYIPGHAGVEEMENYFDDSFAGVIGIADKGWTEKAAYNYVKQMYFAGKHTANRWYKQDTKPFFVAVTKLGGRFGMESMEKDFVTGSLSGLCKSAVKEWGLNVSVHYIDVAPCTEDQELIRYINDELKYGKEIEVGYPDKNTRLILKLHERYESRVDTCHLPDENDVFLVAGGAEGVTSVCIIELARRFHSKFILFGMTEMEEDYEEQYEGMSREEIREHIIKQHKDKGEKIIFSNADKMVQAIISQRQIHHTLEELNEIGSEAVYYRCNIKDAERLHNIVENGVGRLGKITGIVHGAGVLSNALLNGKTEQDFETVFGVKYYGINNMMKEVDSENLKYLFFYSSIAGFFGNFGQSDYSCGNEYLNHFARYWKKSRPNCKVMSLNWGPWDGGMVDYTLKAAMLRRGKTLIEPQVGKMFFIDAFAKVWEQSACQLVINDMDDLGGDF